MADASWSERRRAGRELRKGTPRSSHGPWTAPTDRLDPVALLKERDTHREAALAPVRVARMVSSPFAYFRGAADMMAFDLAGTPRTGILPQICGDAHCLNFGFYGSPRGLVVFDLNDFDETAVGPWEWDLKRLATSLVLAGRGNGASEEDLRVTVLTAVRSYRKVLDDFGQDGVLDQWRAAVDDHSPLVHRFGRDDPIFRRGFATALRHDSAGALPKLTEVVAGRRRFKSRPPLLCRVEESVAAAVVDALPGYWRTTPSATQSDLSSFDIVDIAQKVVGVGSVGTQDFVILLEHPTDERPLFLQLKQAVPSDVRIVLGGPRPAHEGGRIASGQRSMQAVSDPLLGWTTVHGLPFYVRQLKDLKASMPMPALVGSGLDDYGSLSASILGRAHARTADPALIAGYCGRGTALDEAIARFALSYAGQVEQDHAAVVAAVRAGTLPADPGPDPLADHAVLGWPDLAVSIA
jgi:uncharacterized protein (DUF2252 family)